MKILYAIQATGNGHISRASQIIPELKKIGSVDTILSGSNYSLNPAFEVTYRSKGLSLFYQNCGKVDFSALLYKNNYSKACRDAYNLPVEKYNLILNDFDCVTALACKIRRMKSIQIGHQASFVSPKVPRPMFKSYIGETVLKKYAPASKYIGLHFQRYDDFILPPIIKTSILKSNPYDLGHICIYLPSYKTNFLLKEIKNQKDFIFHWFDAKVKTVSKEDNIVWHPIDNELFTKSLITCHGLITGGGFETPSEALYMGKKLLSIPISGQYEQQCNAAALAKMGVMTSNGINLKTFDVLLQNWLHSTTPNIDIQTFNFDELLNNILALNEE